MKKAGNLFNGCRPPRLRRGASGLVRLALRSACLDTSPSRGRAPALPPKSYFWSGDRFPVGYIPNLLRFSLAYCFGISPRPSARAVLPRSGGAALTPPGRDALLRLTGAVILLRSRPGIGRTEVGRARFRLRPRKASPDDPSRTRCLVKIPAPTARYRGEGMRRHLQRASPALASSTSSIRMVHTSAH